MSTDSAPRPPLLVDPATARAERVEARAMRTFVTGSSAQTRRDLGISALDLGGGVALAMRNDPTDYWSKALGFGTTEPITRQLVGEVVRFYERAGVRLATFQIAPAALPADWPEIAAAHRLVHTSNWVKLQRQVPGPAPLPPSVPGVEVGPVPEEGHPEWARVLMAGFGMPSVFEALATSADPEVMRRFGVWADGRLVACASVVLDGDTAGLFGASTLPAHRGHGAQSALIAARTAAAVAAGARWISAETGTETPEQPNSSLHNLRRAGLTDRYERPNWVWRAR